MVFHVLDGRPVIAVKEAGRYDRRCQHSRIGYFVGGLFMLLGYMRAALRVEGQIVTAEERRFLQKHQLRRLLKLRTT